MIKYVKFSVERKKEYQIETSILSINGKDIIQKRAMNESSIKKIAGYWVKYMVVNMLHNVKE